MVVSYYEEDEDARQTQRPLEDISDEWDITFRTNIHSMFYLSKAAVPHMRAGASIINTTSVNADTPLPDLLAYECQPPPRAFTSATLALSRRVWISSAARRALRAAVCETTICR